MNWKNCFDERNANLPDQFICKSENKLQMKRGQTQKVCRNVIKLFQQLARAKAKVTILQEQSHRLLLSH